MYIGATYLRLVQVCVTSDSMWDLYQDIVNYQKENWCTTCATSSMHDNGTELKQNIWGLWGIEFMKKSTKLLAHPKLNIRLLLFRESDSTITNICLSIWKQKPLRFMTICHYVYLWSLRWFIRSLIYQVSNLSLFYQVSDLWSIKSLIY